MPPDPTAPAAPASTLSRLVATPRALLSALAAWLLVTLGVRPLLLPDEGRYANVAREMLHGDLLVPTLNGLPFFHKPPLLYWLDIVAMRLADITPFAGRFASMLGAWLMGAALYFAMRRWHGTRSATIGLLLTATCPLFFLAGQYANHDMLVGGLICTAILAFARAVDEPQDRPRKVGQAGWADAAVSLRWLVVGWIACALAMLAKGLIGFVLPALVIGPWLLARGRWRQLLKLLHPLGLLAFALVAAPWFVAMQLRYPGFNDYFFMEQHFRRYALTSFNNVHPFWFFVVVLPALTVPWAAWLPAALRRAWKERGPLFGLYVWWVIAVVGFFSLPSSKLVGYVLPALAPWCALLALAVAGTDSQPLGRAPRAAFALGVLICLGVVAGLAWKSPKSNRGAALALATQMAADDKVVMVDEYFYDLPFYADLKRPALIASDWDDPELPTRDNWRKELYDAARFDPSLGKEVLRPLARLDELSCGKSTTWFVATPAQAGRVAALTGVQRVYADRSSELWRAAPRSCP
jgi:4-amino-4-deoxy-L-arabinose transferase-like glycosyltransferase